MALYQKTENALIAATTTAQAATFATGISEVHIHSDGDVFISFDENVPTTSSFKIKANTEANPFIFLHGGPTKIWALASSTANVYILVIR